MNKKELVVKYRPLVKIACAVHNLRNVFRKRSPGSVDVSVGCALLRKVSFDARGRNNQVTVGDFSRLYNCTFYIFGSNNTIRIDKWCSLTNAEFYIEDDNNEIVIGEHTVIAGKTHLAAIEGTKISIGQDSLFSSDVDLRTGDSHSLLNLEGKRINRSEDIVIGDHVWVGTKATCLKGAQVPAHSVVGACSLVTGRFDKPNCVLAGVPAKVVKEGVDWSNNRIPVDEK